MKIKASSLGEVLIAITIIAILSVSIYSFFFNMNRYLYRLDFDTLALNNSIKVNKLFTSTNIINNIKIKYLSISTNNANTVELLYKTIKFNRKFIKKYYYIIKP